MAATTQHGNRQTGLAGATGSDNVAVMREFDSKVVVITGAGHGIGRGDGDRVRASKRARVLVMADIDRDAGVRRDRRAVQQPRLRRDPRATSLSFPRQMALDYAEESIREMIDTKMVCEPAARRGGRRG